MRSQVRNPVPRRAPAFGTTSRIVLAALGAALPVAAGATTLEEVAAVVGRYQTRARRELGAEIRLQITREDALIAQAEFFGRAPSILLSERMLRKLNDGEIVAVVCHELGHFFGRVRFPGEPYATEGEADYFSGACLRETFEASGGSRGLGGAEAAVEATRRAFSRALGRRVAICGVPREVDRTEGDYPDLDCRLLSVRNGARGSPRPRCWYRE